jgi:hypothetical protein
LTLEVLDLLQNVQECRNALASGRPEEALEQHTDALMINGTRPTPREGDNDDDSTEGDKGVDDSCYNIMEELMADAVLRPPVLTEVRDSENLLSLSTKHVWQLGSNNSGFRLLRSPDVLDETVVKRALPGRTSKHKKRQVPVDRDTAKEKQLKKEDIFLLSLETVNCKVDELRQREPWSPFSPGLPKDLAKTPTKSRHLK